VRWSRARVSMLEEMKCQVGLGIPVLHKGRPRVKWRRCGEKGGLRWYVIGEK